MLLAKMYTKKKTKQSYDKFMPSDVYKTHPFQRSQAPFLLTFFRARMAQKSMRSSPVKLCTGGNRRQVCGSNIKNFLRRRLPQTFQSIVNIDLCHIEELNDMIPPLRLVEAAKPCRFNTLRQRKGDSRFL